MKRFKKTMKILLMILALILGWCHFGDAKEIKIAIIDSGATSYVDYAFSFSSFPANQDPLDHGTQVAKLVRAGYPTARIYMLQVCEKVQGKFIPSQRAVLQAVKWCVENEMDIVNMSIVTKYSPAMEEAIKAAATREGILFIAAAGNKSFASGFAFDEKGFIHKTTKSVQLAFPSSSRYVISVGALDENGQIASYSGKYCDVYDHGKVFTKEGTSFACARVTSKVAKILYEHPQLNKKEEIVSFLSTR